MDCPVYFIILVYKIAPRYHIWTFKINTFFRDKNDEIKRMFQESVVATYWNESLEQQNESKEKLTLQFGEYSLNK